MKLTFSPYTLSLKHAFTIATSSRSTTPVMLATIEHEGIVGYGEASMPPYLGESHESASRFLSKVHIEKYESPFLLERILGDIDSLEPGNHAAKAAVDIALHDWVGKKLDQPWYRIWGLDLNEIPYTSFTIGIDAPKVVRRKTEEAGAYRVLKVKLGGQNDKEMIDAIRDVTDKPIRVDANQGWTDRSAALKIIEWLASKNVELVEQPMPKTQLVEMKWLKERSPLPLVADESAVRLSDITEITDGFHGVNIKLMKCTGMREAHKMILLARSLGLKVMIGCMTETSCAISAAAQLSPLVDWTDLDGAALISNDVFRGATLQDGRMMPSSGSGIGVDKLGT
ncbi:MAG TPA: dipeptide epimerase [Bacteroidota bacterium]